VRGDHRYSKGDRQKMGRISSRTLLLGAIAIAMQIDSAGAGEDIRWTTDHSTYIVGCRYSLEKWWPRDQPKVLVNGVHVVLQTNKSWGLTRKTVNQNGYENLGAYVWVGRVTSRHSGGIHGASKRSGVYIANTTTGPGGLQNPIVMHKQEHRPLFVHQFNSNQTSDESYLNVNSDVYRQLLTGLPVPHNDGTGGAWLGFDDKLVLALEENTDPLTYELGEIEAEVEVFELRRHPVYREKAYNCDDGGQPVQ
jgi:hypothetical protein